MKCNSSAHILLCHSLFDVIRTNSNLTENMDISSKLKDIFSALGTCLAFTHNSIITSLYACLLPTPQSCESS